MSRRRTWKSVMWKCALEYVNGRPHARGCHSVSGCRSVPGEQGTLACLRSDLCQMWGPWGHCVKASGRPVPGVFKAQRAALGRWGPQRQGSELKASLPGGGFEMRCVH